MKYFLILNPGSKSGKSRKRFQQIFDIMNNLNLEYDYGTTSSLEDAYSLSRHANINGSYGTIVAVGGDGTINRVLNGFYNSDGSRVSQAKMGVIYTGTSPDFCKSYGIPLTVENAVKTLLKENSRTIQVGKIILAKTLMKDYDGKPADSKEGFETKFFACCANIGLGADLARNANSGIRGVVGDKAGTFLALLKTLACYKPGTFNICADGKAERLNGVYNISIGRTHYIASGIKVKNSLSDFDGRFYNLTVKDLRLQDLPGVLRKIYSGNLMSSNRNIVLSYQSTIDIYGNSDCPQVEFDGDPEGFLPCRIEAAKEGLDLICDL
ncbi:MAG: diacylglycerol kinase [Clostridiaceae bacterium]|nr:diacylglycerol kinase [Clostridiaceae bacterium]